MTSSIQDDIDHDVVGARRRKERDIDGGSTWLIVLTSFFCHFAVGAVFYSFALFYIEFMEYFECERSVAGWIGSVFVACFHLSGVFFSVFVKEYGCRPVTIAGGVVAATGFLISAFVTSIPGLYMSYGVITGLGCGMIWLPSLVIVQQYFTTKRPLAAGISTAGVTIGSITLAPLQRLLLDEYGWRNTVLFIACGLLQCCVLGMFYKNPTSHVCQISTNHTNSQETTKVILQDSESEKPKHLFSCRKLLAGFKNHLFHLGRVFREFGNVSLLSDVSFVLFCAGTFCMDIGMIAFSQHNPSRAVYKGVSLQQASLLPLINGISDAVSRVTSGLIGNTRNADRVMQYGVMVLLGGLLEAMFVFATRFEHFVVYTVLFGMLTGGFLAIQQTVQVDLFGLDRLARSQALLSLFVAGACLVTTPFAGFLFDVTQDYDIPFYVTGSVQFAGGVLLCVICVIKRRATTTSQNFTQSLTSDPKRHVISDTDIECQSVKSC